MRIGVEEPVYQELIGIEGDQILDHSLRVYVVTKDLIHFGNVKSLEELHHQNPRGRDFAIDARNDDEVAVAEEVSEAVEVIGLVQEVHFFGNHAGKFVDDRSRRMDDMVIDELFQDEEQVLNHPNVGG